MVELEEWALGFAAPESSVFIPSELSTDYSVFFFDLQYLFEMTKIHKAFASCRIKVFPNSE